MSEKHDSIFPDELKGVTQPEEPARGASLASDALGGGGYASSPAADERDEGLDKAQISLATELRNLPLVHPSAAYKAKVERQLRIAWLQQERERESQRRRLARPGYLLVTDVLEFICQGWGEGNVGRRLRINLAALTIVLLLLFYTGSNLVIASAASSLPDSPLYSIKRLAENTQLLLARDPASKGELYITFATQRLGLLQNEILAVPRPHPHVVTTLVGEMISFTMAAQVATDASPTPKRAVLLQKVNTLTTNQVNILNPIVSQVPVVEQPAVKQAVTASQQVQAKVESELRTITTALATTGQPPTNPTSAAAATSLPTTVTTSASLLPAGTPTPVIDPTKTPAKITSAVTPANRPSPASKSPPPTASSLSLHVTIKSSLSNTGHTSTANGPTPKPLIVAGRSLILQVQVSTSDGQPDTTYTHTIHVTVTDPHTQAPADYMFVAADKGVHSFSMAFATPGNWILTVTDTTVPRLSQKITLRVIGEVAPLPTSTPSLHKPVQTVVPQSATPTPRLPGPNQPLYLKKWLLQVLLP